VKKKRSREFTMGGRGVFFSRPKRGKHEKH
jgi:hypothetical protein